MTLLVNPPSGTFFGIPVFSKVLYSVYTVNRQYRKWRGREKRERERGGEKGDGGKARDAGKKKGGEKGGGRMN